MVSEIDIYPCSRKQMNKNIIKSDETICIINGCIFKYHIITLVKSICDPVMHNIYSFNTFNSVLFHIGDIFKLTTPKGGGSAKTCGNIEDEKCKVENK